MDLLDDNLVRVQLTEDTRSERACLPPLPSSLALTSGLYDAGYFDLEYLASVDDLEGSFPCKAPQSINPLILSAIREDGKTLNRYKGKHLKDVLSGFPKDQCLDLDVEWPAFKGRTFRLVVRWNGKKQKRVFIVTNLDRAEFTLLVQAYRLRWQIELLFKEIKSCSGWHRFNTKSGTLVMSLIILSFLVVTLKRYLAYAAQADMNASGVLGEDSPSPRLIRVGRLFPKHIGPLPIPVSIHCVPGSRKASPSSRYTAFVDVTSTGSCRAVMSVFPTTIVNDNGILSFSA